MNRCGYIQINWNRVEEDEKILEEGITGETEQKKKKTLAKKVRVIRFQRNEIRIRNENYCYENTESSIVN